MSQLPPTPPRFGEELDRPRTPSGIKTAWFIVGAIILFFVSLLGWWCTSDVEETHVSEMTFASQQGALEFCDSLLGENVWNLQEQDDSMPWAEVKIKNRLIFEPAEAFDALYWGLKEGDLNSAFSRHYGYIVFPSEPDFTSETWTLPVAQPAGQLLIAFDGQTHEILKAEFKLSTAP